MLKWAMIRKRGEGYRGTENLLLDFFVCVHFHIHAFNFNSKWCFFLGADCFLPFSDHFNYTLLNVF